MRRLLAVLALAAPSFCLGASLPPLRVIVALAPGISAAEIAPELREAARLLEPHLGRELQLVRTLSWSATSSDAEALLRKLVSSTGRNDCDIVIGISMGRQRDGASSYEEAYIALTTDSVRDADRLLAHEIAHVFGALHVTEPRYLMHPSVSGVEIDSVNAALIELHRSRHFRSVTFPLIRDQRETARAILKRAASLDTLETRLMLARLDVEDHRYIEAIAALESLVTGRPDHFEASTQLAIAYRRSGRHDDALRIYDRILTKWPDDHRTHYNRAIALSHKGNTVSAMEAYERGVAIAPEFHPALSNLGQIYAEHGRAKEAIQMLERAVAIDPDDLTALANLGFALIVAGDVAAARRTTEEVLRRDPDLATAHNTLGKILEAECGPHSIPSPRQGEGSGVRGPCPRALEEFSRAAALNPADPDPLLNLAQSYLDSGDLEKAEEQARRALAIRNWWSPARLILAQVLSRMTRWEEAARELRQTIHDEPNLAAAHGQLGYIYLMMGDPDRAGEATRQALTLDDQLAWAWVNLGVIAAARGDHRSAAVHHQRALAIDPSYTEALANLGHARLALGELSPALDAYSRAIQSGQSTAAVRNNLAVIYLRLGNPQLAWEEALEARKLGATLHPDFIAALERATSRSWPR